MEDALNAGLCACVPLDMDEWVFFHTILHNNKMYQSSLQFLPGYEATMEELVGTDNFLAHDDCVVCNPYLLWTICIYGTGELYIIIYCAFYNITPTMCKFVGKNAKKYWKSQNFANSAFSVFWHFICLKTSYDA